MSEEVPKWFRMTIQRALNGTIFHIKADEKVEQFFKSLGNGKVDPLEMYGKSWAPVGNDPINVYHLDPEEHDDMRAKYDISKVTGDLDVDGLINLSFMRFQGLSKGVSFMICLPMSFQKLRKINGDIREAVRAILQEYILPVEITFETISKVDSYHGQS